MTASAVPFPEISPLLLKVDGGERERCCVAEVQGSAAALLVGALAAGFRSRILVVTAREAQAHHFVVDLGTLAPATDVLHLSETPLHDPDSPEMRRARSQREIALQSIQGGAARAVIVASLRALAARTGDPALARTVSLCVKLGDRVDREELRRALYASGLSPEPLVEVPGQLSLRGDIVDFFPFAANSPVRIELFDDDVESVREFDPETQRSTRDLVEIEIAGLERRLVQTDAFFTALDHFPSPPVIVRVDPGAMEQMLDSADGEDGGAPSPLPATPARLHGDLRATWERLKRSRLIDLHPLFAADANLVLGAKAAHGALGIDDLTRWAQGLGDDIRHIHVFSSTAAEGQRLTKLLRSRLPPSPRRAVLDHRGSLAQGFVLPSLGVWVGNHHELLSRTRLRRVEAEQPLPMRSLREGLELSPGDHLVHQLHGIGLFRGMKEHTHDGGTEDYLILEFDEGTLLYVPASKMEMLARYVGPGGAPPRLDKVGGRSWARKKESVEAAVTELAKDLIELHATRKLRPGHAFAQDDEMQAEFEASFPFADTEGQVTSSEEIKRDMESARAMDRLLCGDVGFGKTEVAMRAVYKCVSQGKQAAVLAPTTLLVQQHLETFRNRFANDPVRIEALSRLTPAAKAHSTVEDLPQGRIDVLIGTHRLLGAGTRFKDLGLVIIDEEQRFGVKHKEHLKRLRSNVDVLTLSATPIPRTLHMALVGLRDVSTLREPPRGRQPVRTAVTYPDDHLVKDAITREMERDGQVFYLFNRVQPIVRVAQRLRELVPRARIAVAHGQLPARELEKVSTRFARGEYDVLVCTTIVESGLDLPNVNTLIVERADMMGLADLHQLRGRIGRGDRQAYAYFLIPRKPLPAIALKRLRALEGLAHLGAGFDIAIRDLEIRGAGNLLGREQSGQIASVGYDLYCQLLAKAIARRQGKKPPPEPDDIDVGLGLPSYLPREYVRSSHQRMGILRRMGEARTGKELLLIEAELRDRFGRIPRPALNLLDTLRLKEGCRRFGVGRIFYPGGGEVLLNVDNLEKFNRVDFGAAEARWVEGSRVHLILPPKIVEPDQVMRFLLRLLQCGDAERVGRKAAAGENATPPVTRSPRGQSSRKA